MAVFWILAGWMACVVTALTLGLALFHFLRVRLHWTEAACLGYIAGAAILSLVVFSLAALHIAEEGVFLALGIIALAALLYFRRVLAPPEEATGPPMAIGWKLLFIAGMLAYGTIYFRQALSPEMSPDAMEYHLGLINQFNSAHGFVRFEDMYAALPQGLEMLFFHAFAIGKLGRGAGPLLLPVGPGAADGALRKALRFCFRRSGCGAAGIRESAGGRRRNLRVQ